MRSENKTLLVLCIYAILGISSTVLSQELNNIDSKYESDINLSTNSLNLDKEQTSTIISNEEYQNHNLINRTDPQFDLESSPSLLQNTEESSTDFHIKHESITNEPKLFLVSESKVENDFLNENVKIIIQKCCKWGEVLFVGQPGEKSFCQEAEETFLVNIFEANATHYWNITDSDAENVVIEVRNPCTQNKYYLDPIRDENDTFHLLSNTSLYYPYNFEMFNTDQYCIDTIQANEFIFTTALICTDLGEKSVFHWLYITGLCVSVVCLTVLSIYVVILNKNSEGVPQDYTYSVSCFAGTMALSYIFVIVNTVMVSLSVIAGPSRILAYIIYYCKLKFYVWLVCIMFDTLTSIRSSRKGQHIKYYAGISFAIPLIFVFISIFDAGKPPLPNLYSGYNFSSNVYWIICLYFVPVGVSLIISGVFIAMMWHATDHYTIRYKTTSELIADFSRDDWKSPQILSEFKKMNNSTNIDTSNGQSNQNIFNDSEEYFGSKDRRRRGIYLVVVIFASFILDVGTFAASNYNGQQQVVNLIQSMLYCLLGMFIILTFIRKDCFSYCETKKEPTNMQELMPINNTNSP